jgi:hypothetical protein
VKIMIASASDRASMSKTRLWTSRVLNAWLVLFLAFDAGVKVLRLSVAVEGTTRLGYPEELVVILGIVELGHVNGAILPFAIFSWRQDMKRR